MDLKSRGWLHFAGGVVLAGVLGFGIGGFGFAQWFQSRSPDNVGNWLQAGQWRTAATIGAENADPITRALIAKFGLLAMSSDETMYFFAAFDDSGGRMRGDCNYQITGTDPDTRWWSITLYGNDGFLVENGDDAFSMDHTRVTRAEDGSFNIRISPENSMSENNWISDAGAGRFSLTLRLYNPARDVIEDPTGATLPIIKKLSCEGESA